jgi:molybdate transport system substrate-binding protein
LYQSLEKGQGFSLVDNPICDNLVIFLCPLGIILIMVKHGVALSLLCLFMVACGGPSMIPGEGSHPADGEILTVFAAASLTDPFQEIGQRFEEANPGVEVLFNFAGSQQLALQLEQGAQADLFASADRRNMDRVVAAGLVHQDAVGVFAHNQIVVILPKDNPGQIEELPDLARSGVSVIMAGEGVPVGAYSRQVLELLSADPAYGIDYEQDVLQNVVSYEENVKKVVAKVLLGEADVGFVYCSDVTPDIAGQLQQIEVPAPFNILAVYPIAALGEASHPDLADEFNRFLVGPDGQAVLERWGLMGAGL